MSGENQELSESRMRRIAREARRRMSLVASRLPRATVLLKYGREEVEDTDRVVVISDTHFGDPTDVLTEPAAVNALVAKIEELGEIDELVLLGDVFDFWKTPVNEALERARNLMTSLYMLENVGRMVFLPGNHDHHAFRMYYQERVLKNLREGVLEQPELAMPLTEDCPVMDFLKPRGARVPLYAVYPIYRVSVRGRQAFMTHGHLLGFFERSLWHPRHAMLATLVIKRTESLGIEEMERFLSPIYEMVTLSAFVPGVTTGSYRVYRFLSRTGRALGLQGAERESAYRYTTVEESAAAIEALLDHFCDEKPDYFVYGHTHRPGKLVLPVSGTMAVNTGCWIDDVVDKAGKNYILEIADEARLIHVWG